MMSSMLYIPNWKRISLRKLRKRRIRSLHTMNGNRNISLYLNQLEQHSLAVPTAAAHKCHKLFDITKPNLTDGFDLLRYSNELSLSLCVFRIFTDRFNRWSYFHWNPPFLSLYCATYSRTKVRFILYHSTPWNARRIFMFFKKNIRFLFPQKSLINGDHASISGVFMKHCLLYFCC